MASPAKIIAAVAFTAAGANAMRRQEGMPRGGRRGRHAGTGGCHVEAGGMRGCHVGVVVRKLHDGGKNENTTLLAIAATYPISIQYFSSADPL